MCGVGGRFYFPKGNPPVLPKSSPSSAAPSTNPCPCTPCQPTRWLPHVSETHPPAPPPEILPRYMQVCPVLGRPSRCIRLCTEQKKISRGPHPQTHLLPALPIQVSPTSEMAAPPPVATTPLRFLPRGAAAAPSPESRSPCPLPLPRPATYLLLDGTQQPLPGLRLCGTRRADGRLAEGDGGDPGLPSRRPPRPASPHPRGPKPWLGARRVPSPEQQRRLVAPLLGCGRGGAGRGRAPSDVRTRQARGPAPPEGRRWASQAPQRQGLR